MTPGSTMPGSGPTNFSQQPQSMIGDPMNSSSTSQQPLMAGSNILMRGDKLMAVKGVYIRQKFPLLQAVTGCQQRHKHYVYALGPDGKCKKGSKMFKCKENSGCCMRQCCTPGCRSFDMDVHHKDYIDSNLDGKSFLKFERPFKCSFLCCNRPFMAVKLVENGQDVLLGKVVNPFECCDLKLKVFDGTDTLKYTIAGSCCQFGVLCPGPCCQEVKFNILDDKAEKVGELKKVKANILQHIIEPTANFTVTFPKNSTASERALLIASALMLDYIYFDQKPKRPIDEAGKAGGAIGGGSTVDAANMAGSKH